MTGQGRGETRDWGQTGKKAPRPQLLSLVLKFIQKNFFFPAAFLKGVRLYLNTRGGRGKAPLEPLIYI